MTKLSSPLKIMMIAPTSFFGDYGGHIRMLEEILAFQRLGHQVTIVTYYKGRDLDGIDIRRTVPLPYRTDYEVGSSRHKLAFDVYLAAKALSVARKLKPDVIHGHMHEGALIGGVISRLLKIPLLFDFQGSLSAEMVDHNFLNPNGLAYRVVRRLEHTICHMPAAILTSSSRASRLLERRFAVPATKLHPLPDCVDTTRFDPERFDSAEKDTLRQELGIPKERTIITYLGLLTDYQGVHHLLYCAQKMKEWGKNVHFLIMGYPNVEKYRQWAVDLGISDCVTLPGRIKYDLAPLYLSLGSISMSAKMSATEGSGKSLNYMAMAHPVVAYDSPVHREFLADLGTYAPSGNQDELALALARLLDQGEAEWQRIGQALRHRVQKQFDWDVAAQDVVEVYHQLLDKKR